jgi:cytochrome P450 PksS
MVAVATGVDVVCVLPVYWRVSRFFHRLFEARRVEPREDLITGLVQAEESGDKLTEGELLAMVLLLLVAGYETTVNLIAGGTLALIQDPEQRERLRKDPALAEPAVEELLRLTSPLELASPRVAREDLEFSGHRVRRGELVVAVLGSANHDEAEFDEPDRLLIGREPNRHMAFGQGPHFCLGAFLARMEAQIALTTLLRRLPDIRLAEDARPRWRRGLILRGLESLPVEY